MESCSWWIREHVQCIELWFVSLFIGCVCMLLFSSFLSFFCFAVIELHDCLAVESKESVYVSVYTLYVWCCYFWTIAFFFSKTRTLSISWDFFEFLWRVILHGVQYLSIFFSVDRSFCRTRTVFYVYFLLREHFTCIFSCILCKNSYIVSCLLIFCFQQKRYFAFDTYSFAVLWSFGSICYREKVYFVLDDLYAGVAQW